MSSVRLGFIGTGGNANRHMRDLKTIGGTELVAFCDVVLEKAEEAAQKYNGKAYQDYGEMLDEEKLDAVYISIPPFAHGGPERAVIKAGLPMFVEKPVHMNARDARQIAKMVEEAGLITAAGYQERYLNIIDRARELLKDRQVGFFMGYLMCGLPPQIVVASEGQVRRTGTGANYPSVRSGSLPIWRSEDRSCRSAHRSRPRC